MRSEEDRRRIAEMNPTYPTDYIDYLDDCYDIEIGNVTVSYEQWKSSRLPNHGGK